MLGCLLQSGCRVSEKNADHATESLTYDLLCVVFCTCQQHFIKEQHATLHRSSEGSLELKDHGISTGTFVNGWRLTPGVGVTLEAGDDVRIGGGQVLVVKCVRTYLIGFAWWLINWERQQIWTLPLVDPRIICTIK